jgi:hypothetical protein
MNFIYSLYTISHIYQQDPTNRRQTYSTCSKYLGAHSRHFILRSFAAARWASSKAVFPSVAATCKLRPNIPHSCPHTYHLYIIHNKTWYFFKWTLNHKSLALHQTNIQTQTRIKHGDYHLLGSNGMQSDRTVPTMRRNLMHTTSPFFCLEDGSFRLLWNIGTFLPDYSESHLRRQSSKPPMSEP